MSCAPCTVWCATSTANGCCCATNWWCRPRWIPDRFSSAVSSHLQVPNGLDSAEHAAYRQALDRFLGPEALAPFHGDFRRVAADLVASLPRGVGIDAVSGLGTRFAVRAQSTWLSWPAALEERLVAWVAENHAAMRSGERAWTQRVAEDFDALIRSVLEPRRAGASPGGANDESPPR